MKKSILLVLSQFIILLAFGQYGSTMPVPASHPVFEQSLAGVPLSGTKAYGYDVFSNLFLSMDLPGFDHLMAHNSGPGPYGITCLDFDSQGDLWGFDGISLYKQDFNSNTMTSAGSVSGLSFYVCSGMAWDADREVMFLIAFNWLGFGLSQSYLYAINLTTHSANLIGTIPGVDACLSLAYSASEDRLYTVDFNNGNLVRINPNSAASEVAGNIGYYQYQPYFESDFNDFTGELILSLVNSTFTETTIYRVNTSNGQLTALNTIPGTMFLLAINTISNPVPVKGYYFLLLFLLPALLLIGKRFW